MKATIEIEKSNKQPTKEKTIRIRNSIKQNASMLNINVNVVTLSLFTFFLLLFGCIREKKN